MEQGEGQGEEQDLGHWPDLERHGGGVAEQQLLQGRRLPDRPRQNHHCRNVQEHQERLAAHLRDLCLDLCLDLVFVLPLRLVWSR